MDKNSYISQLVERVKTEHPEKIILFGSYANGNQGEESDVDLFIIKNLETNQLRDFRINLKVKLWDLIKKWNIPIVNIIVDNQERVNQRIAEGDLFFIKK